MMHHHCALSRLRDGRWWTNYGIPITLLVPLTLSVCLAIFKDSNAKAGLFVLQFNFTAINFTALNLTALNLTSASFDHSILGRHITQDRDLSHSVQSEGASIMAALPGVASSAESAILNAVATALPIAIEAISPRNISLGTRQLCVNFSRNTVCGNLPLGVKSLIIGLILTYIVIVLSSLGRLSLIKCNDTELRATRAYIHLLSGIFCSIPFFIPIIPADALKSIAEHLAGWVQAQKGEAYVLSILALCCAIFVVVCTSAIQYFDRAKQDVASDKARSIEKPKDDLSSNATKIVELYRNTRMGGQRA